MNKIWIDNKFELLNLEIGIFKPNPKKFYFEPTEKVYQKLESGIESDLQVVINDICNHLGIGLIPVGIYEWGIKMDLEMAGEIRFVDQIQRINIPFFYVGKKYALGAILAHEIAHAFLIPKGIIIDDIHENEMLTDLAAVYIGLGKLLLNGIETISNENFNEKYLLGYLTPEEITYCYKKVNLFRSINHDEANINLVPEALDRLIQTKANEEEKLLLE